MKEKEERNNEHDLQVLQRIQVSVQGTTPFANEEKEGELEMVHEGEPLILIYLLSEHPNPNKIPVPAPLGKTATKMAKLEKNSTKHPAENSEKHNGGRHFDYMRAKKDKPARVVRDKKLTGQAGEGPGADRVSVPSFVSSNIANICGNKNFATMLNHDRSKGRGKKLSGTSTASQEESNSIFAASAGRRYFGGSLQTIDTFTALPMPQWTIGCNSHNNDFKSTSTSKGNFGKDLSVEARERMQAYGEAWDVDEPLPDVVTSRVTDVTARDMKLINARVDKLKISKRKY